jgi:hypothetical protein
MRVVSLLASGTELVCGIGSGERWWALMRATIPTGTEASG